MTDPAPFEVDPYAATQEYLPDDLLRIIPPEDKRTVAQQLMENTKLSISAKEIYLKTHCEW